MKALLLFSLVLFGPSFAFAEKVLKAHTVPITEIEFSPEGDFFLTGADDGTIKMWWTECLCGLTSFKHGDNRRVYDAEFFSGGRVVSTSANATAYVWNRETGEKLHQFTGQTESIPRVRISPDGSTIFLASSDDRIRYYNSETYEKLGELKTKSPVGIASYGDKLLTVGLHGLLLWNLAEKSVAKELSTSPYYFTMESLGDNRAVVMGNPTMGGPLQIVNLETAEIEKTFDKVPGAFFHLDTSRDKKWIAGTSNNDILYVWSDTGKLVYESKPDQGITAVAFFPEGRAVLAGKRNGSAQVIRF